MMQDYDEVLYGTYCVSGDLNPTPTVNAGDRSIVLTMIPSAQIQGCLSLTLNSSHVEVLVSSVRSEKA